MINLTDAIEELKDIDDSTGNDPLVACPQCPETGKIALGKRVLCDNVYWNYLCDKPCERNCSQKEIFALLNLPKMECKKEPDKSTAKEEIAVEETPAEEPIKIDKTVWEGVTSEEVEKIVNSSIMASVIKYLASPTNPPLPIEITLPKTLALFGCALTLQMENPPEKTLGISRAKLKIASSYGQACNFWTCLVADSGVGKDIGGGDTNLAHYFGWNLGGAGSAEGMADALIKTPNGFIKISELQNWLDQKHWQHSAQSFLVSSFNSGFFLHCFSSKSGKGSERKSDFCYPNISSSIQPQILASVATENSIENGFLNRFLFSVVKKMGYWVPSTIDLTLGDSLFMQAKDMIEFAMSKKGSVKIPENYLCDIRHEFTDKNVPYRGHWSRLINEYGPRLALLLALTPDNNPDVVISEKNWKDAEKLIKWFYGMSYKCLDKASIDPISEKYEKQLKRFAVYIHKHKKVSVRQLSQNLGKGTTAKYRNQIYEELDHRGIIKDERGYLVPAGKLPEEWED